MNINEAIKIVKKHRKWRKGDKRVKMVDVYKLSLAEECLIIFCENHKKLVSSFAEKSNFKK